jgi:hypothetical protein
VLPANAHGRDRAEVALRIATIAWRQMIAILPGMLYQATQ